ncbi:MAG TPA: polysaccharide biosynthesis tyrosine autokinase [Candidatus Polarisedimenticolia bacterium]|jgi:capsular exopolysaccharide synthesis family protein|nr:polysaccharide biosynthesis tyrosine autokinase [Candidatus Polarisedimenticolia bacterium]
MINSPAPTGADRREVHILDYWRILWRGRWTIAAIFVVITTLVAIGTFTQKPIYRGQASVEIQLNSRKVAPVADVGEMGGSGFGWIAEERYFNTQYEIIRSRAVATRVFDRLDLYNHPMFQKASDPIEAFRSMVHIEPIKDTGIVEISLEGTNPEEVATWTNTVAEAYVDRNLELGVEAASTAVQSLLKEIEPLRTRLADTQKDTFEFAEKANLYVPENQQKITNDKLSTFQEELTRTQVRKGTLESLLRQVDQVRKSGGSFDSIPEISADKTVQELTHERVGLEREYQKLLITYKERHVKVLEMKSELDKLNQRINTEAERIVSNFKTEFALIQDRQQELAREIESTRSESLQINQKATGYDQLRGEATEAKRIYDLISSRMKEIDISASLMTNNLRILDRAPVPKVAVKPRTVLNMAAGMLLALLLGIAAVFFLDYLDNTIRTSEDVEQFLGLNLLAIVPRDTEATRNAVREAYQTLRTSLLFSRKARTTNAVLVTSAGPQEGKSQTTVQLARTLASAGERVVIVDCDLRRPTIHQRLDVAREHGVTNYILSPDDDLNAYLKPTSTPNLSAITCGPIPPNPAEVFGHDRFTGLLQELKRRFDWVLIDSPPVVSLADASILASMCDLVMFVIKHNGNDKELIRRSIVTLRKVSPNVVGAVLNNVDLDRSHYRDYYYLGYYYYGEAGARTGRRRKTAQAKVASGPSRDDAGTRGRFAG